jgi:IS5 family transposase
LRSINELVVGEGHKIDPKAIEDVRGDTFVVQTNIAYPIDSRLVFDSLRKTLHFLNQLDNLLGTTTWRQYKYHVRQAKRQLRKIEKAALSRKANTEEKFKEQIEIFLRTVCDLVVRAYESVDSVSLQTTRKYDFKLDDVMDKLTYYLYITEYLCDLTERRVLQGDKNIPRDEKIFSVFEPHTELINRGKTPLPIEYGHRVLVIEDRKGFIVDYEVMAAGLTDEKILIEVMSRLQKRMNNRIKSASFDKGFYTPKNVKELEAIVEVACLPKKGKLSGVAKEREGRPEFITARKRHAGIESAIHALVAGNGLAICRDKGEDGYHRYVGLAIVGRNLQALGTILLKKARRKQIVQRKAA